MPDSPLPTPHPDDLPTAEESAAILRAAGADPAALRAEGEAFVAGLLDQKRLVSAPLTADEKAELARLCEVNHGSELAALLSRLLADLARVEGERDKARAALDEHRTRTYTERTAVWENRGWTLLERVLNAVDIMRRTPTPWPYDALHDLLNLRDEGSALQAYLRENTDDVRRMWAKHKADGKPLYEVAREERDTARAESARLRGLVRYQRGPLHDAGLITDEEYAALAGDTGAVKRLESYDEVRAKLAEQHMENNTLARALERHGQEGSLLRAEIARLTLELAEARANTDRRLLVYGRVADAARQTLDMLGVSSARPEQVALRVALRDLALAGGGS